MPTQAGKTAAEKQLGRGPSVMVQQLRSGSTVVNILGSSCAGSTIAGNTYIKHWEKYAGQQRGLCSAAGCLKPVTSGGHVKIAQGPLTSLLTADWWIIPTCTDHNKGLSCKTFQVKSVIAVEAPPKFKARVTSWKYEFVKLAETLSALLKKPKK